MSTTDGGAGPDEPRYGRRRPEGEDPAASPYGQSYGQQGQGQNHGQGQQDQWGQQGQPSGYGQSGYGQQSDYNQQSGYSQPGSYPQGGYSQPGSYPQGGYGQPGSYPQAGYGQGGQGTGPAPKRTGPIILIVVSAILMVAAPVIGFFIGLATLAGSVDGIADGAQIINGESVDLPANTDRVIYFETSSADIAGIACTVTGPGGQDLQTSPDTFGMDLPEDSAIGQGFRTAQAGSHTIDCDLPSDVGETLTVGPQLDISDLSGLGIALLIGVVIGFIAFVLLIVGIVWLVRVNKRIRAHQHQY